MADDRSDMILRMLREIRETLGDHTHQFGELRKTMEETRASVITSLGFCAHANVQSGMIDKRLDDLTKRIEVLEHAR